MTPTRPNKGVAANRHSAQWVIGSGNLSAIVVADGAFPAAVAKPG